MIKLSNYLVPLLHTLIGIGNDIYDNFRYVVNEDIGMLDPKDISTRRKLVLCETAIGDEVARRDAWDKSVNGKKFQSMKVKIYRREKALESLGVITSPSAPSVSPTSDSIDDLLQDIDGFVATDKIAGIDPAPNFDVGFQG